MDFKVISKVEPAGWIKGAVYGILLVGLYFSSYTWLINNDWTREDYSYAYIIPIIVLYLIWEKRQDLLSRPASPSWLGLIPFIIGICFYLLGELSGQYLILYLSSWLIFCGICLFHFGWKKTRIIAFPIMLILAMFPLPSIIHNTVTLKLKLISSQMGVFAMRLLGMSAYREGNVIDLGFTQLQVVDACSGLRYLIPLIILGILLAYFFKAALWKKILLVISTIPISIFVNGLRITSVGILYPIWGKAVAEGFFHDFSGWFIFMVSFGILLFEMWILKKVPGSGFKVHGKVQSTEKGAEGVKWRRNWESEKGKKKTEQKGIMAFFQPPQFILAVVFLSTILVIFQGVEFREKIPIKKSFEEFPLQVGEWSGTIQTMEQQFLDLLDLSDYVIVEYKNKQGENVEFYVAYYESQRKGESIHSPETCLPGGGWVFSHAGKVNIPISKKREDFMPVNSAFIQKGDYKLLCYYWFPMRGRILTNAYQMKIYNFWDALTRQRTEGALVRLITSVYTNEELEDAEERLQGFMREIVPVLNEYLPQ